MRITQIFGSTKKDIPSQDFIQSLQFAIRAGMIAIKNRGEMILNPLGSIILDKIQSFISNEFVAFQTIAPINVNLDKWKLFDHIQDEINSYKQLPKYLQFTIYEHNENNQLKLGLFGMAKEKVLRLCIIEEDQNDLKKQLKSIINKINHLFELFKIDFRTTTTQNDFFTLHPSGLDQYVICSKGDYIENLDFANSYIQPMTDNKNEKTIEKIQTPDTKTIAELANLLDIPNNSCAKVVFYKVDRKKKIVICIIRGDLEINENKVKRLLNVNELFPAQDEDILAIGAVPGYASPIGVDRKKCIVIIDPSVTHEVNLVAGANEEGYHLLNTKYGRDYDGDYVSSISLVNEEHLCFKCHNPIIIKNGMDLVNITSVNFKLNYLNNNGKSSVAKIYQIKLKLQRILGAVFFNYDNDGLILPKSISPFDIIILGISKNKENREVVASIYQTLSNKYGVLLDDRNIKPGQKFKDADLLGIPLRIVVSDNTLSEGKVELKLRDFTEKRYYPIDNLETKIDELLK